MRRLAFRVEYDGTGFHGWARQPSGIPTIQQSLEEAIADLVGAPARVDGASRTDAGVHALDQLAAVSIDHPIRPEGFEKAVNQRLPDAIAVRSAWEVPEDFAPRFSTAGKVYRYGLYVGRLRRPLLDRTHWRVPWLLDWTQVALAAPALLGRRDFASFAASDGQHRTSVRTLWRLEVGPGQESGAVWLRVEGNAFMKHMVRNLVGTLVEVARGKTAAEELPTILEARDRRAAGPTAPARGLLLERAVLKPGLDAELDVHVR